ncbi:hypothetical protein B1757_02630 [Acidithiobacillus marinus]|uniref:Uncharacterized protein n=1 Tax=Acidithiobacillus marinus TaxID=187490 RepID=A0A2I1DPN5_9PROT|nr:hypothetical protein B1757_02630 [Acidithiobacillus marinus]
MITEILDVADREFRKLQNFSHERLSNREQIMNSQPQHNDRQQHTGNKAGIVHAFCKDDYLSENMRFVTLRDTAVTANGRCANKAAFFQLFPVHNVPTETHSHLHSPCRQQWHRIHHKRFKIFASGWYP